MSYPCTRGCGRTFDTVQRANGHMRWCDGENYAPTRATKRCARCRQSKPVAAFPTISPKNGKAPFLGAYCRPCDSGRRRQGTPTRRTCTVCKVTKNRVAFRITAGPDICRACGNKGHGDTPEVPRRLGTQYQMPTTGSRPPFDAWCRHHKVTGAEHSTIRKALARYGRSGGPSPDSIIEAYCGEEVYVVGGPPRRASVLRHAVVLLANELARGRISEEAAA